LSSFFSSFLSCRSSHAAVLQIALLNILIAFPLSAYDYDEPCDVVILAVKVDNDGYFTIIGDEKNDRGNEHEIEVDEIFAGHLDYLISEIGK